MALFAANSENSYVVSIIQEQEAIDTDWISAKPSEISKTNISITGSTNTNTSIWISGLTNLLYKALLYSDVDGAKTGIMKLTSINGTDGQFDISDFGLTQTPTKGHLIEKTIDLTANIDTINTTTTQLVLTALFDDPIIIRDGYILVLSNSADGIRYDVVINVNRTLSSDGANQIYTIDISNFGLTQVPEKVNVVKPFMEISVREGDIGLEEISLPIVAGETTTEKVTFDNSGFSQTKNIITDKATKVDLDIGSNGGEVQIISKVAGGPAFANYPVYHQYYDAWHRQNLLKTTNGISGSWGVDTLFPTAINYGMPFILKDKIYYVWSTYFYKATIDANGVVGPFVDTSLPVPSTINSRPYVVTKDRVYDLSTNPPQYLRFDENGDFIDTAWQDSGVTAPLSATYGIAVILGNKVYYFGGIGPYALLMAELDDNGVITNITQLGSQFNNDNARGQTLFTVKNRLYLAYYATDGMYFDYVLVNSDGTLDSSGWVLASTPLIPNVDSSWNPGPAITDNKIYFVSRNPNNTIVVVDVTDTGELINPTTISGLPLSTYDSGCFVTKSRLYLTASTTTSTDLQYISFDGWEIDKAGYSAEGYPYYTFNTLPQIPTKARIRPNPNKILHPADVTYDSANDKITIQYPKVEFLNNPARKIQVRWDAPFGGAVNEELKVDLWKDY